VVLVPLREVKIAVPREITPGEARVALTPAAAGRLVAAGHQVYVEAGAGGESFPDNLYKDAKAELVRGAKATYGHAGMVLKVRKPELAEVALIPSGAALISFLQPLISPDLVKALAKRKVLSFSLEAIPRITRAQSMDALSSQATVSGYKAALIGADSLGKLFPMLMTAAGTVTPARVLVLGAGVAGLQAIATCRRLGGVVEAFDVRAAAKEEVKSLGAAFIELELETQEGTGGYAKEQSEDFLRRQRELLGKHAAQADVVITTALIQGRPAPILLTKEMVMGMKPGSVVVDIAAEAGGNCELTEPGKVVVKYGVQIHGVTNPAGMVPAVSSELLAKNMTNLLALLVKDGALAVNFEDEIVIGSNITRDGEIVHEPTRKAMGEKVAAK
jgi:H+-translocating NAD(P) transhydrogenase subunit alpha